MAQLNYLVRCWSVGGRTSGCRVVSWLAGFWLAFTFGKVEAAQLPLPSVQYFNPYQNPASWGGWGSAIYQGGGASVSNVSGTVPVHNLDGNPVLVLDSVSPPGGWWNVLFKISGNSLNYLRTGTNPAIHLRLKWSALPTNGAWNMNIQLGSANLPLSSYLSATTNLWQDVYIPTSDFTAVNSSLDLTHIWQIALYAAGNYRDHCILHIAALDLVPSTTQLQYAEFAKLNQLGYAPLMPDKLAVVSWESGTITTPPTWFKIVNATNSQIVLTGAVTQFVPPNIWQAPGWPQDGDVNYQADFGALRMPGVYRLELPELGTQSQDFAIATNVYHALFRDALRFFYYSRASVPITGPNAEGYSRVALHPATNAPYNYDPHHGHFNFGANTTRDVHGCWFDAGDTHIDVPNTATACWFLLETFRDFGQNVPGNSLNLPESSPSQSALVPLISWGLDWFKRMQNANGSVHHYLRGHPNTGEQQLSDISSFATACAAAVFAKAYVVMGGALPPTERVDLLDRAQLAWSWLQANPNVVQPRLQLSNGVDPGSDDSSWGDANFDRRCRAFAAVELFEATGDAQFNSYFTTQFGQNGSSPLNGSAWGANATGFGSDNVISYLNHPLNFAFFDYARSTRGVNGSIQATLKNAFLHQADVLTNYTALSGYRVPMLYPFHLFWGSSGGVLVPSAMVLTHAFEWTGNSAYHRDAIQALHFICGRNPVNRVFVSGYGDYQHGSDFYAQFWPNLLQQPPGYLGGNIHVDGSAKMVVQYPWKRFINTQDADMTEPGVYWNSAFAWLAGYAANDAVPPTLQTAISPAGITIDWPLRSTTFVLERAANLQPGTAWTTVTNQAVLSDRVWRVSLPIQAGQSFYRLRAP